MKGIFIDGLPANIQNAIQMYWGCERYAHFFEITQYVDTLLEQMQEVPERARMISCSSQSECGR